MEFGAIQCKPKNPNCSKCPLQLNCVAFSKNEITVLPRKIKGQQPVKKYFNYLVYVSKSGETIIEQRKGKGIWENLYQFPLIESEKTLTYKEIKTQIDNAEVDISLYNTKDIIHKLSHQHLHTKFWIIETNKLPSIGIPIDTIHDYATPVLIKKFIEDFKF